MTNAESVKRYQDKRDAIMLRPTKDEGATIRAAAAVAGQSVQGFVLQAVRERMERMEKPPEDKAVKVDPQQPETRLSAGGNSHSSESEAAPHEP